MNINNNDFDPNPDKEVYEKMTQKVIEKGGYCPCSIYQIPDTICPCKEFREQETGFCYCQRFVKVEKK